MAYGGTGQIAVAGILCSPSLKAGGLAEVTSLLHFTPQCF